MRCSARRRRARQEALEAERIANNLADSGYSSLESSPEASPSLKYRLLATFDGSSSFETAPVSPEVNHRLRFTPRYRGAPSESRSLSAPSISSIEHKENESTETLRRRCSDDGTLKKERVKKDPQTPDRYVPRRDYHTSSADTYRVTKSIQELSAQERILRSNTTSSDYFTGRNTRSRASNNATLGGSGDQNSDRGLPRFPDPWSTRLNGLCRRYNVEFSSTRPGWTSTSKSGSCIGSRRLGTLSCCRRRWTWPPLSSWNQRSSFQQPISCSKTN